MRNGSAYHDSRPASARTHLCYRNCNEVNSTEQKDKAQQLHTKVAFRKAPFPTPQPGAAASFKRMYRKRARQNFRTAPRSFHRRASDTALTFLLPNPA
jgi:hypothetical protein